MSSIKVELKMNKQTGEITFESDAEMIPADAVYRLLDQVSKMSIEYTIKKMIEEGLAPKDYKKDGTGSFN